jgi:hypothetical protein
MESPSAATTTRSGAGIRLLGYPLRGADVLAHDVIPLVMRDDLLDRRLVVSGEHCEQMRIASQRLVVLATQRDPFRALGGAALAQEIERLRCGPQGVGDILDALVNLAEQGFVQPDSLYPTRHPHNRIP